MKLEAVALAVQPPPAQTHLAAAERRQTEAPPPVQAVPDEKKAAPEEILKKISDLTENGLYSVRFEKNEAVEALVIKLVNSSTGEVIRQIPSEELLGSAQFLKNLRGNMINTES